MTKRDADFWARPVGDTGHALVVAPIRTGKSTLTPLTLSYSTTILGDEAWHLLEQAMPAPETCDGCGQGLVRRDAVLFPYGPFTAHLCPTCAHGFSALSLHQPFVRSAPEASDRMLTRPSPRCPPPAMNGGTGQEK